MPDPSHVRITHRDMRCRGPISHSFRCRVIQQSGRATLYAPLGISRPPLSLPVCPSPSCAHTADDVAAFSGNAMVPENERFAAWLALDGSYLSVPGDRNAKMPVRYEGRAIRVEGYGLRDLDRFDAIRSAQTGNDAYSEMNYTKDERDWRDQKEYDPDDMTAEI